MEIVNKDFNGKGKGRPLKYPFNEMKKGSCLEIMVEGDITGIVLRRRLTAAILNWKKRNGKTNWETAVRLEDEGKYVRVFRMK
jgi:hypothetical protein